MSQPWQVSYCTTGAAIWGESGRTPCRFPPLFVYSKSCRTTWSCALPKTKINSVVVQHCNPERALLLERHAVCMLWWLACSPVSVLPSQGRFLFPSSPRIHNFPCDFIYKKLIFPGQQWVVSLSSWGMGVLEENEGPASWEICGVGSTSWMPVCWEASGNGPHTCSVSPPPRSRRGAGMKVHGHGPLGKQSDPSPFDNILGSLKKQPDSPMSLRAWLSF